MSAVDVLAVMDASKQSAWYVAQMNCDYTTYEQLREAREAVANLIDKVDSALTFAWNDTTARELRDALARVQGEQP